MQSPINWSGYFNLLNDSRTDNSIPPPVTLGDAKILDTALPDTKATGFQLSPLWRYDPKHYTARFVVQGTHISEIAEFDFVGGTASLVNELRRITDSDDKLQTTAYFSSLGPNIPHLFSSDECGRYRGLIQSIFQYLPHLVYEFLIPDQMKEFIENDDETHSKTINFGTTQALRSAILMTHFPPVEDTLIDPTLIVEQALAWTVSTAAKVLGVDREESWTRMVKEGLSDPSKFHFPFNPGPPELITSLHGWQQPKSPLCNDSLNGLFLSIIQDATAFKATHNAHKMMREIGLPEELKESIEKMRGVLEINGIEDLSSKDIEGKLAEVFGAMPGVDKVHVTKMSADELIESIREDQDRNPSDNEEDVDGWDA